MKRRILAAALSAALILSLAACGGGTTPGGGKGGSSSSNPAGSSAGASQPEISGSTDGSDSSVDGSASSADISQPDGSGVDASQPDPPATETKVTLTLNKTSVTLNKAGATFKLRYTTDPEIDADPTYTSSDKKIATVDNSGTVKAVAPGKATITVECGGATATASVTCGWTDSKPEASQPTDTKPSGGDTSKPADPPAPAKVDLSAFYSTIAGKYEFAMLDLADDDILDMFYEGMSKISTEQRLIYVCGMNINNGEFGLVQVKDSKDVAAVKNIFQARIDAQASGGAWYPQAVESWSNNARVVSNGNYVMMVVHENCDAIVKEFNALF